MQVVVRSDREPGDSIEVAAAIEETELVGSGGRCTNSGTIRRSEGKNARRDIYNLILHLSVNVVDGRVPGLLGEGGIVFGCKFAEADRVIVCEDGRGDLGCKVGSKRFDEARFQGVESN